MYRVLDQQFEGPLDLLLSLIEKERMDITQISLARITGSYLEEISKIEGKSSDLADFLLIAAKLLYIKSRNLLPNISNVEEESEIDDLEERLREYQRYKHAAKHLENILDSETRSYSRRAKNDSRVFFTPPSGLDGSNLFAIFQNVLTQISKDTTEKAEMVCEPKISLEERITYIGLQLSKKRKVSFRNILISSKTKIEIIVTFLAILEMVKQKKVRVVQHSNFADFDIMSVK
jgi:segregation and condensation protein A